MINPSMITDSPTGFQPGRRLLDMKVLIIQENGRHEKNRHFRECFALQSAFQRLGWKADIWGLGHSGFPSLAFSETGDDTRFSGSGQGGMHKMLDFNAYDVI